LQKAVEMGEMAMMGGEENNPREKIVLGSGGDEIRQRPSSVKKYQSILIQTSCMRLNPACRMRYPGLQLR
jgi:hypothetical protein